MEIQDIARNTFTISALLLTATTILLNYSWKRLNEIIKTMPEGKRGLGRNLKSMSDPIESEKYIYTMIQFLICGLLALSFAGSLLTISTMSAVMVGDTGGLYSADNFEFAVVSMRVSTFFLFMAMMFSGFLYLEDFLTLWHGVPSRITTKLEDLPKLKPIRKVWAYAIPIVMALSLVIAAAIDILVPYNQWVKLWLAVILMLVLYALGRFANMIYRKINTKSGLKK